MNDTEYRKVESIFAVSDIHGHYLSFIELLRANKIVDKNLDWNFGKGHLVIAGDVFDRGDLVTECLWLIFKLEYQAEQSGGKVHYLLGNHELMILKDNDKTYADDKYILPYAKAMMDYHDLFGQNYVLGQWIRSKNIAVKINNLLFVHGGIPPDFVDQKRSMDQMNQSIHEYMADTSGITLADKDLIIEPTWYRGYFEKSVTGEDLARVCKYYKVDKVIVGHTPVNQIKSLQDNYVIGVGIPFTVRIDPPKAC
ncbi:MAG: metallophosphoesterase [Cyclobacteriaceae bacterium]|nr:metallophosphoesterase [Cyclobacteriaceae bacterium]